MNPSADDREVLSRIARLHAVSAGLAEAGTPEEVAEVLARESRVALDAAQATVSVPVGPGEISVLAASGLDDDRLARWARFPASADVPVAACLRSGEPIWLASADDVHRAFPVVAAEDDPDAGALAVAPLAVRGQVLGALALRFASEHLFGEDEQAMTVSIARTGAQALQRAFLFDAEREARARAERAHRRTERLQDLTAALATAISEQQVIDILLREGPASLDAKAAFVFLARGDELQLAGATAVDAHGLEIAHGITREGGMPATDAVARHEPFWFGTREAIVGGYPMLAPLVEALDADSWASIPLESGGVPLGALGLVFDSEQSFDAAARDLIVAIARQSALALQRVLLLDAERERETRLRLLMESNVIGSVVAGERQILDANQAFLEMIGRTREELEAGLIDWPAMTPPEFADIDAAAVRRLLSTGRAEPFEKEYLLTDGTRVPVLLGLALLEAEPFRCIGFVLDLTERKASEAERQRLLDEERAARAEAEVARERLAFLAEVSAVLASSIESERTLESVARTIVPRLATMCSIELIDENGALQSVALAHADPEKERWLRELRERHPPSRTDTFGPWAAIESNRSQLLEEIPARLVEVALERTPEIAKVLRALELRSAIVVPLSTGERPFGAITLLSSVPDRRYSSEDLALAQELSRRAAAAIENARLYAEGRRVADILQRSLLPPILPEIPGIEVAGQFRVAMDSAMVGGDFYDVFESWAGAWVAALGDIMGKGAAAAAVMGVARQTVRAAALGQQRPSQILRTLNESLLRQTDPERYATVACARVRPGGDVARVTVSCGGHPSPLVLRHGGEVDEIECTGTILGILPDPELVDVDVELSPGDTLVLYSDGVTDEHAVGGEEFGQGRLEELLRASVGRTAGEIATQIVSAVEGFRSEDPQDDITVLALRVRPFGRVLERVLRAEPSSVPEARHAMEELRFRVSKGVLDDVRLLVSELVTNSVRHSGAGRGELIALRVDIEEAHVRVEVADHGVGFDPVRAEASAVELEGLPGGWGLRLVEQVADRWGVERDDAEVCVWFELAREE
ncbi:MAG: SpoIIE family protein phosphatase [Actinomycetota bacterium]